jgi:hypothetical protein
MLSPDARTLYSECLQPPPGYRFDKAVGTTFTLDLESLLVLPFTLLTQRCEEPGDLLRDPVKLLEGLRESVDRFTVFFQHGRIHAPDAHHVLFGLLEDAMAPVVAPSGRGVFHPKLWILRFLSEAGAPLLRTVILSRNLTFDRSWDVVACMEGTPTGRNVRENRDLAALLRSLPAMCVQPLAAHRAVDLEALADEALRTVFEAPDSFRLRQPVFHAIGLERSDWQPDISGDRLLVVSPFVSTRMPTRLGQSVRGERTLLSREEELNEIKAVGLEGWDALVLDDAADGSGEVGDSNGQAEGQDGDVPLDGLHAKLIAVEKGARARWWMGSANFTEAAWSGNNVEFMVEFEGWARDVGIARFLESGLGALCKPYMRAEPSTRDAAMKKARKEAERVRDAISAAGLSLACREDAGGWGMELLGTVAGIGEADVVAWPVTIPESHARSANGLDRGEPVHWKGLPASSLTSLVAFSVRVDTGGERAGVRFAINLPCDGFPEDRHARIVQQIITSSDGFFRYLRQLLGDWRHGLLDLVAPEGSGCTEGRGSSGWSVLLGNEMVLEDIIRTASREPERLGAVDRLIDVLMETEEGRKIVPPDFHAIWESVRAFRDDRRNRA